MVGLFPSVSPYLMFIISHLVEYTGDGANENSYIKADKLGPLLDQEMAKAAN